MKGSYGGQFRPDEYGQFKLDKVVTLKPELVDLCDRILQITMPVTELIQNPNYAGKRSLYLFPWKNGKGYYATLYEFLPEDAGTPNDRPQINLKKFTGIIAAWDLKMGFTGGVQFSKGAAVNRVNIEYKERNSLPVAATSTRSSGTTILDLPPVTVVGYTSSSNWGMFYVTLMNFFGNTTTVLWGNYGNSCEYGSCTFTDPSDYFAANAFAEPPNNDDNDGVAQIKIITKSVKDPCLAATLQAAIDAGLANNISDMLHNTFGESKDFNITFKDEALNDVMKDGETTPFVWNNQRIDFDIKLNTEVLPNASKEYTAAVIYHEIVHAYLRSQGSIGKIEQHNTMGSTYQTQIASSLQSLYPSMSSTDAAALAWGGLMGSTAWSTYQSANPSDALNAQSIDAQYRVQTKGTGCN